MPDIATIEEALVMVRALMRDDPVTFKQGYTAENAALAVEKVYGIPHKAILGRLNESLPDER